MRRIAFFLILFSSCHSENCDSILFIKEIEKPILNSGYYGSPSICVGLFIVNDSANDMLKIDADSLLYYYTESNQKVFLRKTTVSNSVFEVPPNSNKKFCLFIGKGKRNSLEEIYSILITSTIYIGRNGEELMICK